MSKIAAIATAATATVVVAAAGSTTGIVQAIFGTSSSPSATATTDIPANYLALYRTAATNCPGLDWTILAAIGKIESDHGRSPLPGVASGENHAGAGGPMQFLQPTRNDVLARHHIPPGGRHPPIALQPARRHPRRRTPPLRQRRPRRTRPPRRPLELQPRQHLRHRRTHPSREIPNPTRHKRRSHKPRASPSTTPTPNSACPTSGAATACTKADSTAAASPTPPTKQPASPSPRTAQTQYNASPLLPPNTPLLPGDLVFYSNQPGRITHVSIAISPTHMINAPYTDAVIRIDPIGNNAGATRPANGTAAA
jgi:hypothetical protein